MQSIRGGGFYLPLPRFHVPTGGPIFLSPAPGGGGGRVFEVGGGLRPGRGVDIEASDHPEDPLRPSLRRATSPVGNGGGECHATRLPCSSVLAKGGLPATLTPGPASNRTKTPTLPPSRHRHNHQRQTLRQSPKVILSPP
jgi:hypothetical protein